MKIIQYLLRAYSRIMPQKTEQERISYAIEKEVKFYRRMSENARARGEGGWTPRKPARRAA